MDSGMVPEGTRGRAVILIVVALVLVLAPPASARRKITFGANLNRVPDSPYTCGSFGAFNSCSWESIDFTTGESAFPPVGKGVITKFRVRVGAVTGPMQIVVEEALRQNNPSDPGHPFYYCCKAVRTSGVFTPPANTISAWRTKLSVTQSAKPNNNGYYVDDHLALSVLASNVPIPASSDPNATLSGWFPAWTLGEERGGSPFGSSGYTILFNADWERR